MASVLCYKNEYRWSGEKTLRLRFDLKTHLHIENIVLSMWNCHWDDKSFTGRDSPGKSDSPFIRIVGKESHASCSMSFRCNPISQSQISFPSRLKRILSENIKIQLAFIRNGTLLSRNDYRSVEQFEFSEHGRLSSLYDRWWSIYWSRVSHCSSSSFGSSRMFFFQSNVQGDWTKR